MNRNEVKAALEQLRPTKVGFTLIFSGKGNSRVNGLYHPASHEIVIHNKNFRDSNNLMYTALHEYAHHIMVTEKGGSTSRSHTLAFWATLHELTGMAEGSGLYVNPSRGEAIAPTTTKLENLIAESGRVMRRIGDALLEAAAICEQEGGRFDDYVMRTLKQTMPWAKACMAAAGGAIPEELGTENMKAVAAIKNVEERAAAVDALTGDLSPQQVKAAKRAGEEPADVVARLEKELARISKTIEHLTTREAEIAKALEQIGAQEQIGATGQAGATS
jgi:hypothetical protein